MTNFLMSFRKFVLTKECILLKELQSLNIFGDKIYNYIVCTLILSIAILQPAIIIY